MCKVFNFNVESDEWLCFNFQEFNLAILHLHISHENRFRQIPNSIYFYSCKGSYLGDLYIKPYHYTSSYFNGLFAGYLMEIGYWPTFRSTYRRPIAIIKKICKITMIVLIIVLSLQDRCLRSAATYIGNWSKHNSQPDVNTPLYHFSGWLIWGYDQANFIIHHMEAY